MADIKIINPFAGEGRHRQFTDVAPEVFEVMRKGGQSWGIDVTNAATAGETVRWLTTNVEIEVPKGKILVCLESDNGIDISPFFETAKKAAEMQL